MQQDSLWTGLRVSQVKLVASYWLRFSLRTGGGLVTLLLVLMVGLSVASIFITPVENIMRQAPAAGHTEAEGAQDALAVIESEGVAEVVKWVIDRDDEEVAYLLKDNPALLSAIFIVFLWLYPFIICFGASNQTAGDIGSRGLRYVLLRTERPNILLGRFTGTVAGAKIATLFMFLVLVLYVGLKFGVYPWGAVLLWGLQGYLAVVFLILPYIALCTWVSSFLNAGFSALALCIALTGIPIVLLKMVTANVVGEPEWIGRLIPWGWKYDLLSGDVATRLIAYGVMLGFTALFLLLAFRTFHKRDL